jgi:shikimate kinase
VVATGGGICDNPQAIEILKKIGKFILLEVPENICLERILKNSKKTGSLPGYISRENPKNQKDIEDIFHQFYERRMKSYKEISDFTFYPNPKDSKQGNITKFVYFAKDIFML